MGWETLYDVLTERGRGVQEILQICLQRGGREGVKKSQNLVDVFYGSPPRELSCHDANLTLSGYANEKGKPEGEIALIFAAEIELLLGSFSAVGRCVGKNSNAN